MSAISDTVVRSGANAASVPPPELRSKAATSRPSCAWKSTSSRASSVVPTRERGEATMVTEWRNDIGYLDPSP